MSNVINLRVARKQKARADKERIAAENRVLFGRTTAQKAFDRVEAERTATFLDGHRVDKPDRGKA